MSDIYLDDDDRLHGTLGIGETDITRKLNLTAENLKIGRELAASTSPVLILIRGIPQGKRFVLEGKSSFILGRGTTADIQVDDANVSRHHVQVTLEGDRLHVADMGSRNGTFLNDQRLGAERVQLAKEDMLKVGNTILKYLPAGQLETLFHINITNAAHRDPLTGLFNRKYISDVLEVEFKRAKALHTPMSAVSFDIDDFKKVNDTYGHECGDHVLVSLGARMRSLGLGERDLVGRYGGEEFLVVLTGSTLEQAAGVAARIRSAIEDQEFDYRGTRIPVTVSLGVATVKADYHAASDLYRDADRALYESKRAGKNRVTVAN